jgi:hypothetical protein
MKDLKRLTSAFLFGMTICCSLFANVVKTDVLRVEFIDDNGSETFDVTREYIEGNKRLIVQLKPERVSDDNKDEKKPSVVWKLDVQAGTVSVLSNFSQIPGDVGTEFDIGGATIANYRIYLSTLIKDKHEIRFLYAPLQYETSFVPSEEIKFGESLFLMGTDTDALYKFNSYRLSYIYHFDKVGDVQFRLGFTAKIRDAETSLTQQDNTEAFTDLGFVPLLHLGAKIELSKKGLGLRRVTLWMLDSLSDIK